MLSAKTVIFLAKQFKQTNGTQFAAQFLKSQNVPMSIARNVLTRG